MVSIVALSWTSLVVLFFTVRNVHASWPILAAELAVMEQLDIPYFGTTARSNDLTVGVKKPLETIPEL